MDIKEVAGFKMIVDTPMEQYRYETFYSKEPETIAWINDMQPGEVLYDVGANIGIYTLYAASRGVKVVAIEPVLENFHRLVQNVELNGFDKVFTIYGSMSAFKHPFLPIDIVSTEIGSSGSQIIEASGNGTKIKRSVPSYTLDDTTFPMFPPHYIKIDVDGYEMVIFGGMFKTLILSDYIKSYLIELNHNEIFDAFKVLNQTVGFTTDNKYNTMTPHSRERRQRKGITAENVVFTRIT